MTVRDTLRRSPALRAAWHSTRRVAEHARSAFAVSFDKADPKTAMRMAYEVMLGREPDPEGVATYLPPLQSGQLDHRGLVRKLRESSEFNAWPSFGASIHSGRRQFVHGLPRAERILDLGGSSLDSAAGALVTMGYPYPFKEIVIVDLPDEDRHEIYRTDDRSEEVETRLGAVRYRYHSMSDLSDFEDASFDLVYSGQTIEHVPPAEGASVFRQVFRVLRPGGYFALDTPNGRVTRVQQDEFIDPDHEVEYELHELVAMATDAGYEVLETKGLNFAGDCLATGTFDFDQVANADGIFAEAADCYILCLLLRKPL